jgi:hypothetical protein
VRLHLHDETWLVEGGMEIGGVVIALPAQAIARVFARYGKPLEVEIPDGPAVDGVIVMPFMRWGDVEPQAYAVLVAERLAAPAPLVAAALSALARATSSDP